MTAVYGLTVRGLLGERRSLALLAFSALAGLVAIAVLLAGDDFVKADDYARIVNRLLIPVVAAFVSLIVATSAFGDEREDGSILYLAATPLHRLAIAAPKVLAAWTVTLVLLLPAIVAFAADGLHVGTGLAPVTWMLTGVVLATLGYCAAFVLLSLVLRRAVVGGILYIALWEGSVASFAPSAGRVSIGAYGRRIAAEGTPDVTLRGLLDASAWASIVILLVVAVAAALLSGRRLGRMELP